MSEVEFRDRVSEVLRDQLPDEYEVETGKSILYKMIVNARGRLQPSNYAKPKRGQFAFQTDILISNDKVPLVVIETKSGGFSTHDVLTYSTKAAKHKEVYPYLRYGFIVGGRDRIDRKFFIHNSGIDFAIATEDLDSDSNDMVEVVRKQISAAELMLDVLEGKLMLKKYVANLEWSTSGGKRS